MRNLSNITIVELRAILAQRGLTVERTKGGHEMWSKEGMPRPVVFQTHKQPIPEFVVQNAIKTLGMTKKEFIALLESL
jgi:predicted RNA binding protein YcfA (HicA-like mRNA interferase family)